MLQDKADESEQMKYSKLSHKLTLFFFDLLILGYVEDISTGWSFRIPSKQWKIFVEVSVLFIM